MKKKGFELSINFLVMFIISVVIFIFGVGFVYKIYGGAMEEDKKSKERIAEMMEEISCSSSLRVCIGNDNRAVGRGEVEVFTIKVVNIDDSQLYRVIAEESDPPGYDAQKEPLLKGLSLVNPTQEKMIEENGEASFGIAVEVPKKASSGEYIFNVKVLKENDEVYSLLKFYVRVP